MKNIRPTIADVARAAGVSVGTVSHVLNNSRGVSTERRDRVLHIVEELGYAPNLLAQGLRRTRSTVIGLCVPHANFAYFVGLAAEIERRAAIDGYDTMHLYSREDSAMELHRVRTLLTYKVGGFLLLPTAQPQKTLDVLADSHVPVVVLDRPIDDRRFDQVTVDTRAAMQGVSQYLIGLGHRRLLFITGQQRLLISQRRIDGIRQAIRQSGEPVRLDVLERGSSEDALHERLQPLLSGQDRPTAIITTNTVGTGWLVRILRQMGIACPAQISLVAADEPRWAGVIEPRLAAIHTPAELVAGEAWDRLLARMRGDVTRPRRIALDAELRLTGTIGPPPR